jgi:hypothetical protein
VRSQSLTQIGGAAVVVAAVFLAPQNIRKRHDFTPPVFGEAIPFPKGTPSERDNSRSASSPHEMHSIYEIFIGHSIAEERRITDLPIRSFAHLGSLLRFQVTHAILSARSFSQTSSVHHRLMGNEVFLFSPTHIVRRPQWTGEIS